MLEWLLLLLPVAAASGWLAGKRSAEVIGMRNSLQPNSAYFAGINYLLNEQPDKAVDAFLDILEVDGETAAPHFALGNLFRQRGEVGQAIRIHQNLMERSRLSSSQREQALLELGLDYMRAGMLDRAENLFLEVLKQGNHREVALRQLLEIYQQEKNWRQAIIMAQRLWEGREAADSMVAHFYCELAEQWYAQRQKTEAAKFTQQALVSDPHCVRAMLLQARLAMEKSDYKTAIRALQQVEQQGPDYLPEILEPLSESYRCLGSHDKFLSWLEGVLKRHPGCAHLILAMVAHLQEQEGEEKARRFLIEQLKAHPFIEGSQQLLALGMPDDAGTVLESWSLIEEVIGRLLETKPRYSCRYCGFGGRHPHWQCPGCKRWGTVKPVVMNA